MRSGRAKKHTLYPDPVHGNRLITRIINKIMRDGKKTVAQKQMYKTLDLISEKVKNQDSVETLKKAIDNIKPIMEVRSRRVGGAAYQVPMPVKGDRKEALAIRWLLDSARNKSNKEFHTFSEKLADEIILATKNEGAAIKKRDNTHKSAEANKAFAHFRW